MTDVQNPPTDFPRTQKKGKSLPPKLIIKLGKFVWSTMWHTMMSKIAPRSKSGSIFVLIVSLEILLAQIKIASTHQQQDVIIFMWE